MAVRWRCFLSFGKRNNTRLAQGGQLADDAHEPILQISKIAKTVNFHMQVCARGSRTCQDKIGK